MYGYIKKADILLPGVWTQSRHCLKGQTMEQVTFDFDLYCFSYFTQGNRITESLTSASNRTYEEGGLRLKDREVKFKA